MVMVTLLSLEAYESENENKEISCCFFLLLLLLVDQ